MRSSEKKLIQKAIDKEIDSGKAHKEIFQSLSKNFNNKEELFELLSKTPTKVSREQYKIWNYILAIVLFTTWGTFLHALITDISASTVLVSLYFFFLIKSVIKWRIKNYFWIAVLNGLFILLIIGLSIVEPEGLVNIHAQLILLQNVILLTLSIWLEKKLLPKTSTEKVKLKDENDRWFFKKVYCFERK